jgi:hypothetical protein
MSLNANAILALDEAHEELKETSTQYDGVLERRINALSSIFETLTGLKIAQRALTQFRVDGSNARDSGITGGRHSYPSGFSFGFDTGYAFSGRTSIHIPTIPVQAVTRIEIRQEWDEAVFATITDTATFILKGMDEYNHSFSGQLELIDGTIFLPGRNNVLLDMTIGFATTHPVLSEVHRLMSMQLQYEYKRWQRNEGGLLSSSVPDGSISFAPATNILKEVADGLMNLRDRWRLS